MELVLALLSIVGICLIALSTKPVNTLYALTFVVIFFSELGPGFTSFTASIFFNQESLGLFKIKLIEILIASSYLIILFTKGKSNKHDYLKFYKYLLLLFACLVTILTMIGISGGHGFTIIGWRLMVTGILFLHLMHITLDSEEKIFEYVNIFLILLGIRALIGLIAYTVGFGVDSPRGTVPFFWDSRQVAAFAFGVIMLTAFLAQNKNVTNHKASLNKNLAIILIIVLSLTVLLSIRRTSWAFVIVGAGFILITERRINVLHYSGIAAAIALFLAAVIFVPALDHTREKLSSYMGSLNLFDQNVASQQQNAVHVDNVEEYSKIIFNNNNIILFGYIGREGDALKDFTAEAGNEFDLGKAHNGILRTMLIFGIGGLFIYLAFYLNTLLRYNRIKKVDTNSRWLWIIKSSFALLMLQFGSELTFVPPFYTSVKGLIYTFIPLFFVYSGLYYSRLNTSTEKDDNNDLARIKEQNNDNNKRVLSYKSDFKK